MSPSDLHRALAPLRQAAPSVPLDTVRGWVRRGRPRPRFHALAWLSRVGWW